MQSPINGTIRHCVGDGDFHRQPEMCQCSGGGVGLRLGECSLVLLFHLVLALARREDRLDGDDIVVTIEPQANDLRQCQVMPDCDGCHIQHALRAFGVRSTAADRNNALSLDIAEDIEDRARPLRGIGHCQRWQRKHSCQRGDGHSARNKSLGTTIHK